MSLQTGVKNVRESHLLLNVEVQTHLVSLLLRKSLSLQKKVKQQGIVVMLRLVNHPKNLNLEALNVVVLVQHVEVQQGQEQGVML